MLLQSILLAFTVPLALAQSDVGRPCGFRMAPCPFDMKCVPDNPYCPHPSRCPGHCEFKNQYDECGGFTRQPHDCPEGFQCQDDPRLPPNCGMACDAPGICVPDNAPFCRGFIGLACPAGLYCYDVLDDCDPENGGADCIGICL